MIGDASQSLVQGLREAVLPLPPNVPEEWLDDDCLKRFLRADGNDFEKARERLRGTLKWRDEVQPSQLRCAACAEVDPHSHYMQQVLLTRCFARTRKLFASTLTSFHFALKRAIATTSDSYISCRGFCCRSAMHSLGSR
jgi:hypothetical protein